MKIVLCVCTYRRPEGLRRLLDALTRLEHGSDERPPLEVVVVDNDAAGEGLAACRALPPDYPYPVHARQASERGISAARNLAVATALALDPDLVAFLDDDEWPSRRWLAELLRVRAAHDADVVGGPTRSVFPPDADPALAAIPYYGADLGLPDGARCRLEAGGNFLIRAEVLRWLAPEPFDAAFQHSGSEDLAFFHRLARLGAHMRWARDALVHEEVPPARLERRWLRERVINVANGRVRAMQMLEPGAGAALLRGIKTAGLLVAAELVALGGVAHAPLGTRGRLMRWRARGKLAAHLGRRTERRESY